jgi:tetratricopeptide (TPR) repeat protein
VHPACVRRLGGVYMKSAISVALLVLLSAALHAQTRRASGGAPANLGLPVFDYADLLNARSNLQFHAVPPARQGGTLVPASQLRIPAKAIKEYELAQKAFQQNDVQGSADHLQKALHIYPDFIDAHNALGLRFMELGDIQKALAEHEIALSIDPRSPQTHEFLSFDLLMLDRIPEAETEARQSLDLDSHSVVPRYVLGRTLIAQRRITPEAIEMLRASEDAFPDASLVLAQVHYTLGRTDEVIADLRHYLRAPSDADNKQKAECWAARLSGQPPQAGCSAEVTPPSFH